MNKTMDEVREDCITRIENLAKAINDIKRAIEALHSADALVESTWKNWAVPYSVKHEPIGAVATLARSVEDQIHNDLTATAEQAGMLIARDVIAPVAREAGEPVIALTGNSFFPALRSLDDVERIWQVTSGHGHVILDMQDEVWGIFVEAMEATLDKEQVMMSAPDHDNMLYVTDLKRWAMVDSDDDNDPNYHLDAANWTAIKD